MPKKENFSIFSHYFSVTHENVKKYGEDTIVYMQVGGFFELYGIKKGELITGSKIEEIANICDLQCKEKKVTYEGNMVYMAGIPLNSLDKYIERSIQSGYTAVVYVQGDDKDEKERIMDSVYSPGTYISSDTHMKVSNHIMCIWIDKHKSLIRSIHKGDLMVVGISSIDVITGESSFYQYETEYKIIASNFDELQRYVSVYNPSETIVACAEDVKNELGKIMDYSGINSSKIHYVDMTSPLAKNATKQVYQNHIVSEVFQSDTFDVCLEFREKDSATKSYCYLLDFVKERNPKLVNKISLPIFNNVSSRVTLANHTLIQLNILDDASNESKRYGKKSSIMSFLNQCCTTIGKRRFRHLLTNPTTDEKWLQQEYSIIGYLLRDENYELVHHLRNTLHKIKDIEKISRQVISKKVFPASIYDLYDSIQTMQQITTYMKKNKELNNYLVDDDIESTSAWILNKYDNVKSILDKYLIIQDCEGIASNSVLSGNIIIRPGISDEYDDIVSKYNENKKLFDNVHTYLNAITNEVDNPQNTMVYVKIHKTEKSGSYFESTLSRSKLVKKALKLYDAEPGRFSSTVIPIEGINMDEVKFISGNSGNKKIECDAIDIISRNIVKYEDQLTKITMKLFSDILEIIEFELYDDLRSISKYIGKLDLIQCKAYNAKNRNYCCPEIQDAESSFVDAKSMRHCLIEYLQQNELYVPNDITIGKDTTGILLYGTNAVGKTSLIRALGICVIMAQCGMYVPCSSFVYKPYTAVFSRILGNDNLFRGLSTFAVEMSELRVILNNADNHSLILGDELCSGTELQSALSIFVSGLKRLHDRACSFIFATHFHDVIYYDEVKALTNLSVKHMEVTYNPELDALVYDRILKDGPGSNTYGLEVCKSLHLDVDFLDYAYQIRNKYFVESSGALNYNTTRYNAAKLVGKCEMCGVAMGTETHHLAEQHTADKDGFIHSFHKNHQANLVSICETCHNKEHSEPVEKIKRKKKTTAGKSIIE